MFEDRNSIFFSGFVLGAIFSYSGMMGFFGGCLTGIFVITNYGKIIKPENRSDNKIDWIEIENGNEIKKTDSNLNDAVRQETIRSDSNLLPLDNIKNIFTNYIKSGKK
jgi:hypothetical protein